jgi:hypothetical protein
VAGSVAHRELGEAGVSGFRLASRLDDGDLRMLLRRSVMSGPVRVAFTREPDYFAAEGLAGAEDFTVVARPSGRFAGMGRCSVNSLYRNGQVQRVGYLGELRSLPGTRASPRLLRDAYAFMADTLANASVDAFFTSVTVDNSRARRVLERGAAFGLPTYRLLTSLVTLVAPIGRSPSRDAERGILEHGNEDTAGLTAFLQEQASRVHLSLAWNSKQWSALARSGITPSDFHVVREAGCIVAAAAVWDQRAFRQTVVDGYGGALRLAWPLVNLVQSVRGLPHLPARGSALAQGAVLGASVAKEAAWPRLWSALHRHAAMRELSWLTLAIDARDPLLPLLRSLTRAREYHTMLYEVTWKDLHARSGAWDARLFRPEVGLL